MNWTSSGLCRPLVIISTFHLSGSLAHCNVNFRYAEGSHFVLLFLETFCFCCHRAVLTAHHDWKTIINTRSYSLKGKLLGKSLFFLKIGPILWGTEGVCIWIIFWSCSVLTHSVPSSGCQWLLLITLSDCDCIPLEWVSRKLIEQQWQYGVFWPLALTEYFAVNSVSLLQLSFILTAPAYQVTVLKSEWQFLYNLTVLIVVHFWNL